MPADLEKQKQQNRAWYLANRERVLKLRSERYAKHKESEKAYSKAYLKIWREKNREKYLADAKEWRDANRARRLALNHKYNAQKRGATGSHTSADVAEIWTRQKHKCAVPNCTYPISESGKNKYSIDHVKALSNGGSNDKSNLQILCRYHNSEKHARDEYGWAQEHGLLFVK